MRKINFSPPDITKKEIKEVIKTLKSGWITTGPKTKEFEKKIAQYCKTEKAIVLNSATAGLELILKFLGIKENDEVIVPAYTYTATASVVAHIGAKIKFIDNEKNSFTIDYEKLEENITSDTKAIILVDLAGVPANYDKAYKIAQKYKEKFKPTNEIQKNIRRIAIIGDGAHSFGASYNNIKSGNLADFTSFSFHAVKNLTTAEGGAVTWKNIKNINNNDIYNYFKINSLHGQSKDALEKNRANGWEYDIKTLGYKYNMTDIMASIGIAQLKRYNKILNRRKEIINMYNKGLKNCNIQILEHFSDKMNSSGHLYLTRLIGKDENYRNEFIKQLSNLGISTNVHYKPLPMMTAYKNLGYDIKNYPNSYDIYKNEITLPLHTLLSNSDINYIIKSFKNTLRK